MNATRGESRRRRRERLASKLETDWKNSDANFNQLVIAEALDSLTDDLREIVLLRIWSNLTLSEVADTLNSSTATIHRRYQTALEQLKTHFESPCANKNDFPTN